MYGKGLRALSIATVILLGAALALAFFYAPLEVDQGVIQKIFYVHVPLAIVSLCGFVAGGVMAIGTCAPAIAPGTCARTWRSISRSCSPSARSRTGSIWAKASWGHWWVWSEPVLVSFLIVFLLYCCYQPLRFSIDDPERQARYASVFAITAGAFVPLNFIAVRLATAARSPARALGERQPAAQDAADLPRRAARSGAACSPRCGSSSWRRSTRAPSCRRLRRAAGA